MECADGEGTPGELLWEFTWAGPAEGDDEARAVDIDGDGRVIAVGVQWIHDSSVYDPWLARFDLDGTQVWIESPHHVNDEEVDAVAWVAPDQFLTAGWTWDGATLRRYSDQAELSWDTARLLPSVCDDDDDGLVNQSRYTDVVVGTQGLALGLATEEDIGDGCYEKRGYVERRRLDGGEVWDAALKFGDGFPTVAISGDSVFAAADDRLYAFDGGPDPRWEDPNDAPAARNVVSGPNGELYEYGSSFVAELDADGNRVWTANVGAGVLVTDAAVDPCDGSVAVVGERNSALFWVAKVSAEGDVEWEATADPNPQAPDRALGVAIAGDGTVVAVGRTNESWDADIYLAAFAG